jgi:PAS domain S-box-containing protein
MHPYILIPILSTVGAGALASTIGVRDPGHRTNQRVGLLFLSAALWSLCEVFCHASVDPEWALRFARWASLGALMLGPLAFHLALAIQPQLEPRFRRLLQLSYAATLACVVASVATPWRVAAVTRTGWGWASQPGPAAPFAYAVVAAGPLVAISYWLHSEGAQASRGLHRHPAIVFAGVAALLIASLDEVVLPALGFPVPRLGCAAVLVAGAVAYWTVYRFRAPALDPRGFAPEILETLPDGVALLRLDGCLRATNAKLCEMAGRPPEELRGRHVAELLTVAPRPGSAGSSERECELVSATGRRIAASLAHSPLRDEEGTAIGHVIVVRDLREVVSLRSRLVTSGQLAAVGELAAGIAHEINNPIAYVRSNVSLLEHHWSLIGAAFEKSTGGPQIRDTLAEGSGLLREALEGVDRVAAIVRDVGGFSRSGPAERELGDVNELLDTAVRVGAHQIRERARVERHYAELPLLPCVPQELMQVFLNLVLNAAQSIEQRGTIRLVTESDGDGVLVRVEDDGRGIPPDVLDQIFDPFFTTKPTGEGTGLGLAISRQIIARHGGEIRADSEPGRGTRFQVRLPAGHGAPPPGGEARPQ